MRIVRATAIGVGLLASLISCSADTPTPWHEEGEHRWRELRVPRRGRHGFTELNSGKIGIPFTNVLPDSLAVENRWLANGSGVALGDVDGDGLVDVFLAGIDRPSALYRNLGNWKFKDVTSTSGISTAGRHATGAALADVDGDGDLDLLVTSVGGPNALWINDGKGRFREVPEEESGLTSRRGSTTIALADLEGDGDLDLYIANYKAKSALDLFPPHQRAFDQVVRRSQGKYVVAERFVDHYRVHEVRGKGMVLRSERAEPDWLYLNDGAGRFRAESLTSGRFLDAEGRPLRPELDYFGLAARFYDVNGDGAPDLYICNDFEDPDEYWINDGAGRLRLAPELALRTTSYSSMGVDFSDIDRDGDIDFFVTDMLSRDTRRRKRQVPKDMSFAKQPGEVNERLQVERNSLQLNRGDGTFADIAGFAGVEASGWSWGAIFLDVDLDGYEDILVATGYPYDNTDAATAERIRNSFTDVDWKLELLLYPKLALKNVAFRNNGDLTFVEVGEQWGFASREALSYGVGAGDLDGDGDLDVVVTRLGSLVGVFRNKSTAPRLAIRLRGLPPNTDAVGARIRVQGGPVPEQTKEVTAGGLYLSSSDRTYTFATGSAQALTVIVHWRSGKRTVLRDVRPNRLYEIRETTDPSGQRDGLIGARPSTDQRIPYFADVSHTLHHQHTETAFDDYARQPLLPNRLSELGPGLSWYDVDGDGDEDLFVAPGRGGTLAYFRNDGRTLTRAEVVFPQALYDATSVLAIPDGSGKTVLLIGQSSYEAPSLEQAVAVPSVLQAVLDPGNGRERPALAEAISGDTSSAGPLALGDVDGDGDLDLFVGGRVIPGRYPAGASSRLYRNEGGRFVLDEQNQPALLGVGLVSAALFSDVNGDGAPDLLVASEWGPLKLLLNERGRFRDLSTRYGLTKYRSRWNGIATGDLDGDGRLDIIATSWGRNTKYRVTDARPLLAYYGDLDGDEFFDVVEAQYDPQLKVITPLPGFMRMALTIRRLQDRIYGYTAYADATIDTVLGPGFRQARRLEVNTLDHMIFLNRGTRFEAVALPSEAQFAPAFYAGVADFNGDGREDVFLAQNFFPTDVETQRYDAGRGLLLTGDGRGSFLPVPAQVSGVVIYGDQRGAAFSDFNADGRVDLAVSQNGGSTKLYRNDGARPGLRVRLIGPSQNPHAIGAMIRVMYGGRRGPAREVQAGSGYWSHNGAIQVLGLEGEPRGVWIRWPGGSEMEVPVRSDLRELTVSMDAQAGASR